MTKISYERLILGHIWTNLGPFLGQNWSIFPAISRTSFPAGISPQIHFPFPREMRECCQSITDRKHHSKHDLSIFSLFSFQSRELSGYFSFRDLDRSRVGIILEKSLQELVDQSAPTSSIKFRLACRGLSGVSFSQIHYAPETFKMLS